MDQRKERIAEVMNMVMDLLPMSMKLLVQGFCPNFLPLLEGLTDEEIDHYIEVVEDHLNYIKNGDDVNE